ncbi:hypothetical protein [Streptomyces acidicola]|uniref:hypothetical protein n=1 Tax=Streptomyces acidicola TaxID=2596892 RepID=UPI00342EBFC9
MRGAPYGSDLRLCTAAGISTLQYEPGGIRHGHSARERVRLPEIAEVTRTLALTVLRTAGTK